MNRPADRTLPAAQAGAAILRTRVCRIAATGRLRVSEQRAVDLIRAAGTGAILTMLSTAPDERDPALADALFEAVLRDILTGAPGPPDSGPTTPLPPLPSALTSPASTCSATPNDGSCPSGLTGQSAA